MTRRAVIVTAREVQDSYSQGDVAAILHVSPRTVRRYIATGELDSIRVANTRRVTQRQLEDHLARKQRAS